ncbi:CC/Se motif family (seleno)protein [Anaerobacillus arseniciselenatis]|nr:CC/Se motif family (seleno)protein [Anaerobacillus arseniciselenatis]
MDHKTKTWIKKKGNYLTIKTVRVAGCCVGRPIDLLTKVGKPNELKMFHQISLDDITVYVQKGVNFKNDQITLNLFGIGLFKIITAEATSRF